MAIRRKILIQLGHVERAQLDRAKQQGWIRIDVGTERERVEQAAHALDADPQSELHRGQVP